MWNNVYVASRRFVQCHHLKRGLPSRPRASSALLHTAPHRTPRLLEPKKGHWCGCSVKQREKRQGERRAGTGGQERPAERKGHGTGGARAEGTRGWPCLYGRRAGSERCLHGKSPERQCCRRAVCTGSIRGGTSKEIQVETQFSGLILSRAGLTPARDKINPEKRASAGTSFSGPPPARHRPAGCLAGRTAGSPVGPQSWWQQWVICEVR